MCKVLQSVAKHVLPVRHSHFVVLVKFAYVVLNGLADDDKGKASQGKPVPLL